jgi:hypothetical protein
MKETSSLNIDERLFDSLSVCEEVRSGQTCEEIRAEFVLRYNQAASTEANVRKWETETVLTGFV